MEKEGAHVVDVSRASSCVVPDVMDAGLYKLMSIDIGADNPEEDTTADDDTEANVEEGDLDML